MTLKEILDKATARAFRGGLAGMGAMVGKSSSVKKLCSSTDLAQIMPVKSDNFLLAANAEN